VRLLKLKNISLESLSEYFVEKILQEKELVKASSLISVQVKISSGPGQWASFSATV